MNVSYRKWSFHSMTWRPAHDQQEGFNLCFWKTSRYIEGGPNGRRSRPLQRYSSFLAKRRNEISSISSFLPMSFILFPLLQKRTTEWFVGWEILQLFMILLSWLLVAAAAAAFCLPLSDAFSLEKFRFFRRSRRILPTRTTSSGQHSTRFSLSSIIHHLSGQRPYSAPCARQPPSSITFQHWRF